MAAQQPCDTEDGGVTAVRRAARHVPTAGGPAKKTTPWANTALRKPSTGPGSGQACATPSRIGHTDIQTPLVLLGGPTNACPVGARLRATPLRGSEISGPLVVCKPARAASVVSASACDRGPASPVPRSKRVRHLAWWGEGGRTRRKITRRLLRLEWMRPGSAAGSVRSPWANRAL
jgi:hypothetical protein